MEYDVAVFEFCVQHDYSSDDGSDAIQSGSWSRMPVPIDLFYTKPHDEVLTKDDFTEDLDELFRDAHSSAREILGTDQRRQEDQYWKKVHGEPYAAGDKIWVWAKEKFKSRKLLIHGKTVCCTGKNV